MTEANIIPAYKGQYPTMSDEELNKLM